MSIIVRLASTLAAQWQCGEINRDLTAFYSHSKPLALVLIEWSVIRWLDD